MPFQWFVALRYLRDAKGQTALILAAVSVGVSVVVFLSALINGLQSSLIDSTLGSQPHVTLRVPREAPRPLVEGDEIVMAPHVVPANAPAGRYLHGVDVVRLLELAPAVSQVPDLFELYTRRGGLVSLHDFLLALSTAVARGWLVSE